MKQILLVSSGFFHPPMLGRWAVRRALGKLPGYTFRTVASLERLPADLSGVAALVLFYHHQRISDEALRKLREFVSGGGGVLALHSATASFKDSLPYFEVLGGRFTGHGAVEPFQVTPVPEAPLFAGVPAFTVTDELYLHEAHPGIVAHFTTRHQDQDVPVVWTYSFGQGRVCYAVPGHRAASMRHPAMQQILRMGLAWAARD
jgi:type 1 glutamine amidotransferase